MQKCQYCGFVTKYKSDTCPMCGATKYDSLDSFAEYEIQDSTKFNFRNIPKIKKKVSFIKSFFVFLELLFNVLSVGLFVFLICLSIMHYLKYGFQDDDFSMNSYLLVFCIVISLLIIHSFICGFKNKKIKLDYILLLVVCLSNIIVYTLDKTINPYIRHNATATIGMIGGYIVFESIYRIIAYKSGISTRNYVDSKKENKKYDSLINNGVLIKNIPYELVEVYPNKYKIKIKWKSKDGLNLELLSKQIVNQNDTDKNADLLIDKKDFGNYYIDYEIT